MDCREIPSISEWKADRGSLDEVAAKRIYAGRSNEEMMGRYYNAPVEVFEELRNMPDRPYCYYLYGFLEAINSVGYPEENIGSAVSCFLQLVPESLQLSPNKISPILNSISPKLDGVANIVMDNPVDFEIYPDVKDSIEKIRMLLDKPTNKLGHP